MDPQLEKILVVSLNSFFRFYFRTARGAVDEIEGYGILLVSLCFLSQ